MGYKTITKGLTLTIPTAGTVNWANQIETGCFDKISEHDHTGGGKGLAIDTAALANSAVTTAKIANDAVTTDKLAPNFGLTQNTVITVTGLNQSVALDWNNGMIQVIDVTAATGTLTITATNPQPGASYKLFFKQPATALTITWPVTIKWAQAQAPIFTETLNAIDSVSLYYNSVDGVYWSDWQVNYA